MCVCNPDCSLLSGLMHVSEVRPSDVSLNLFSQQAKTNRPFQFQKRSQLFIRTHNEALNVVAMRVCNPDCSPVEINGRNAAPAPTGFAEIVGDDFLVLHTATDSGPAALLIVEDDLRGSFVDFKLCTHLLDLRCLCFH
jgi:hypothetical protein